MTYDEEFREALIFSKLEGCIIPRFTPANRNFITQGTALVLLKIFAEFTENGRNPELLYGQCVGITALLSKRLREELGWTSFVTLGKISHNGTVRFAFSQDDVRRWRKNGIEDLLNMPLHAWITLPSMEIIDFTLSSSVIFRHRLNKPASFDAGHWEQFIPLRYHPVVVGDNVPELLVILV